MAEGVARRRFAWDRPAERLLAWTGEDEPASSSSKLRAFRFVVFMEAIAENLSYLARAILDPRPLNPLLHLSIPVMALTDGLLVACFVASFSRRWERLATAAASLLLLAVVLEWFPETGNHQYLAFLCMALLAATNFDLADERQALLQTLRWIAALALFQTGLQKFLYGLYFHGEFLAHAIAQGGRFSAFFAWLLPASELARLQALGPAVAGAGPYRPDSLVFLLASNGTMAAEMGLPALLLFRKTRVRAALAVGLFLMMVEGAAREFCFGVLFINLMLLFAPKDLNRKFVPAFAIILIVVFVVRVAAPDWGFR